jgi:hypothetical protein
MTGKKSAKVLGSSAKSEANFAFTSLGNGTIVPV